MKKTTTKRHAASTGEHLPRHPVTPKASVTQNSSTFLNHFQPISTRAMNQKRRFWLCCNEVAPKASMRLNHFHPPNRKNRGIRVPSTNKIRSNARRNQTSAGIPFFSSRYIGATSTHGIRETPGFDQKGLKMARI
jgi:hypothetical protein